MAYAGTEAPPGTNGSGRMSPRRRDVTLGDKQYVIVPQRHGYLQKHLGSFFGQLTEGQNLSVASLPGHATYSLLRVFIPNLMPEWEYGGYTEAAWTAKEKDRKRTATIETELDELLSDVDKIDDAEAQARITKLQAEREKLAGKEYIDDATDRSPDSDQIYQAIMAGIEVNHFDLFKHLKNFLTPEVIRGFVNSQATDLLTRT